MGVSGCQPLLWVWFKPSELRTIIVLLVLLVVMLVCRSDVGVNLYTWNRVSVFRINQLGGLSVNGGRPVRGQSAGQLTELNLPMSIYVAGYPVNYNRQAGATSGFHGAIQRVK